jgi:hypothetical protein
MPYLIRECNTPEAIKLEGQQAPPFGPGFSQNLIAKAAKLIVTGSSFKDPGGDWVKFELFDPNGKALACKMIAGY